VDPLSCGLVSTTALLLAARPMAFADGSFGLPLARLGAGGIFVAILVAILTAHVQRALVERRLVVSLSSHAPEAAIRAFEALLPATVTLGLVFVLIYPVGLDLHNTVGRVVTPLLSVGNTLGALLVIVLIDSALWLIGVHPVAVLALAKPLWLVMLTENFAAASRGEPPPHIGTRETFLWFIWIGGSGLTLPLSWLCFRARAQQLRSVARVGLVPALFNINDAFLFGMPIVLSGAMAIPFIVAPLCAAVVTFVALKAGLVFPPHLEVLWTLPAPLGAYLSTRDWRAVVLCLFNLALATAIYYPFVRRYDRKLAAAEEANLSKQQVDPVEIQKQ
jgi:cellobiose PTS system EIIC component